MAAKAGTTVWPLPPGGRRETLQAGPVAGFPGMVGARVRQFYDDQAKERQKVRKGNQSGASVENLPQLDEGTARDQVGKAVGVSGLPRAPGCHLLKVRVNFPYPEASPRPRVPPYTGGAAKSA